MKKNFLKLGLVTLALTLSTYAQAGVLYLGTVSLMDRTDRDVLNLPRCAVSANRPVDALKLTVTQYDAQVDRLVVEYQNGQKDELYVKEHFNHGDSSRWIDLNGGKRCIKQIVLIGDTDTPRRAPFKQAKISFFGRD